MVFCLKLSKSSVLCVDLQPIVAVYFIELAKSKFSPTLMFICNKQQQPEEYI